MEQGKDKILDFEVIAESKQFKTLTSEKKKFVIPLTIFFLICYISLPVLTSYSHVLETSAIGAIPWVWVYSLALFVMTWTLCMLYVKKSASLDKKADQILAENES